MWIIVSGTLNNQKDNIFYWTTVFRESVEMFFIWLTLKMGFHKSNGHDNQHDSVKIFMQGMKLIWSRNIAF